MADPARVFISYSSKDIDTVDRLKAALANAGVSVWLDHEQLTPGTPNWQVKIRAGINQSTHVVYVASPDAAVSDYVILETDMAKGEDKTVFPFWIRGEKWYDCAPMSLAAAQYIDGRGSSYASGLTKLLDGLGVDASTVLSVPTVSADEESYDLQLADWFHEALGFFEDRLAEAFPGVRGLQTYSGAKAFDRLLRLLRDPLTIPSGIHQGSAPLWWWHGGSDMEIRTFRVLDTQSLRCLLGTDELVVDTVSVYRSVRPYRSFVYISTHPDEETGAVPVSYEDILPFLQPGDVVEETVGLWNGHYITADERADGYAEIDGEIMQVAGAELRRRYMTPYNLFITSQTSVFNSIQVDAIMEKSCKSLLAGEAQLSNVVTLVETLALPPRIRNLYETYR